MAARIRKIRHDDNTRAKIQVSQLINRLEKHAFGEIEMSPTQVRAIEVLLRKKLPDLSAVDASVQSDNVTRILSDAPMKESDWNDKYAGEGDPLH